MARRWSATTRSSPPSSRRCTTPEATRVLEGADRPDHRQTTGSTRRGPRSTYDRVQCPTLLIAGEDDPFANTEQMIVMKAEMPPAEWLIVNHAGHAVHSKHPEIVGPRMVDFLLRHS